MMDKKPMLEILEEQMNLLAKWNTENIDFPGEIEQVRRNIETIRSAVFALDTMNYVD